jgi:hypothetical protein
LLSHLLGGIADLDTTLEAIVKVTLTTATSMDLSLENELGLGVASTDSPGDSAGLLGRSRHLAILDLGAKGLHEVLGLVLVEVQETTRASLNGLDGGDGGDGTSSGALQQGRRRRAVTNGKKCGPRCSSAVARANAAATEIQLSVFGIPLANQERRTSAVDFSRTD